MISGGWSGVTRRLVDAGTTLARLPREARGIYVGQRRLAARYIGLAVGVPTLGGLCIMAIAYRLGYQEIAVWYGGLVVLLQAANFSQALYWVTTPPRRQGRHHRPTGRRS